MRRGIRARGVHVGDLVAGAVLLTLTMALVLFAFTGFVPFRHAYQIHALVRDANQLRVDSPVRIAGVNEGAVTAIDPAAHETTRVTFTLSDSARPIHADATVSIRPRTFLEGGFYIDLHPGTPPAPDLASGATIPLAASTEPVQLSQVLSTFTAPVRDGLRTIFAQSAIALGGGTAPAIRALAPQLSPTLRDAAWLAEAARGTGDHDLSALIRSAAAVTGTLAVHDRELAPMVAHLQTTSAALTVSDGALAQGVTQLDGLLHDAPPALSALSATMPALQRFSVAFDPPVRQAPPLVSGISDAVRQFGSLVAPGERERVVASLRGTLRDLPQLLVQFADAFPPLKPAADCLSERIIPTLDKSLPDGSLSTGAPAWEDLLHALVGLASNSQNFDGNGFWSRYLVGGGTQTLSLPVLGGLLGSTPGSSPITGSRPVWLGPGTLPPVNTSAACTAQPLVTLSATTGQP